MKKLWWVILILAIGAGYYIYSQANPNNAAEVRACEQSGGKIVKKLCCKSTKEYTDIRNLPLGGGCGSCSAENSSFISVCDFK